METKQISEELLYEQWVNHKNLGALKTLSGEDVEILDIGVLNKDEAGPDFRNSRIRIGSFVFIGDVEIDINYSDWVNHGHNINNRYNKVILHLSLFNKHEHEYVYSRDGRKIPNLTLYNYLENGIIQLFTKNVVKDTEPNHAHLKCFEAVRFLSDEKKIAILSNLGIERLNKKCERVVERLRELSYVNSLKANEPTVEYQLSPEELSKTIDIKSLTSKDIWEQAFYEFVFEALGYSKNKTPMLELAKAADLNYLKTIYTENNIEAYEASLFNIGNLFNENLKADSSNLSDYIKGLVRSWNNVKHIYDGKILTDIEWHFFKLRPQNFPTIRIAGGARFIDFLLNHHLLETIVRKIKEIHNLQVLISSIRNLFVIKAEGYWKEHYVFEKPIKSDIKYFIGAQRADEIIINVIFPFFMVYFDVFGMPQYSKKILQLYNVFTQKSENQIINEVAVSLKMEPYLDKTIVTQGMIEVFRSYCSKNKCTECQIGEQVFN